MSSTNVYVPFIERCRKDDLVIFYYLQHNGNKEELTKLYNYVDQAYEAGRKLGGERSSFDMSMDTLIPEEDVNLFASFKVNPYIMFYKLDGTFKCPISEEYIDGTNSDDLTLILEEHLRWGKVRDCFSH